LIELLVTDIIEETFRRATRLAETGKSECFANIEAVAFSEGLDPLQKALNKFIYEHIIFVPAVQKSDGTARKLLRGLFRVYSSDRLSLPQDFAQPQHNDEMLTSRAIADFIAGMTDNFAIAEAKRLRQHPLFPNSLNLNLLLPPSIVRP
jgi:dGTPase